MKHLNKLFIKACLCLPLLCTACAGDYLDTTPTNAVSPSDLFKSEDYAEYAVNGLAKLMKTTYTAHSLNNVYYNGEGSIRLFYADWQGADMYIPLNNYYTIFNGASHAIPSSLFTVYPWHYYYKIVSNANTILSEVNPEASSRFKYIYAQALTYRAFSYLQLLQFYAPRWCDSNNGAADGVVLRLETSAEECPIASMAACYQQVYNDLDRAIALYQASGRSRAAGETHKINIDAAYAIYARAALTREDWETAAHYAALARTGYPLMSNDEYLNGGFSTANQEWIWSIYDSIEETLGNSSYAVRLAYNSDNLLMKNYPPCINKMLYDKLPASDIRRQLWLNPYDEEGNALPYYTHATANYNGRAKADLDAYARRVHPDIPASNYVFAYMSFKFKCLDGLGVMPYSLFRSAEMYLIEAEADCHLTPAKETEAQQLLNALVRDSGRDASYNCTATGQALLDEIKFQRRIELWGEGFSWFDYKRRRDTIDDRISSANGGNYLNSSAVVITPEYANNWMWVIPEKETNFNDGLYPEE